MELKEGYKETEVGIIPNDWKLKTISEISNPVRGGSPRPAGDPKYFNGNFIPWLTVAALTNIPMSQIYVSETENYLTKEGSLHSRILEKDTLIIANSGATLGVAKLLSMKCCANDGIAALLDFDNDINKSYLVYFINTKIKYLRDVVATGNGQPNLNTDLIGNITVPIPPTKSEQTVIATTLSDIDALIENLDKLINKKQNIKLGVMQELLTGKNRLTGFNEEWLLKKLGDVAEIHKGQLITEKTAIQGHIPVIAGGVAPSYYHNQSNRGKNTITVSASGANAGFVAFHQSPIFASDCSTIEDNPKYEVKFIYFSLLLSQNKIFNLQTGGAQPHVYPEQLKAFEISLPACKREQTAIADILTDIDTEIKVLEQKLQKYRMIKQGMMQVLLTGKIRLI